MPEKEGKSWLAIIHDDIFGKGGTENEGDQPQYETVGTDSDD